MTSQKQSYLNKIHDDAINGQAKRSKGDLTAHSTLAEGLQSINGVEREWNSLL